LSRNSGLFKTHLNRVSIFKHIWAKDRHSEGFAGMFIAAFQKVKNEFFLRPSVWLFHSANALWWRWGLWPTA